MWTSAFGCGFRSRLPLRGSSGISPDSLLRRFIVMKRTDSFFSLTHVCDFDAEVHGERLARLERIVLHSVGAAGESGSDEAVLAQAPLVGTTGIFRNDADSRTVTGEGAFHLRPLKYG